jgi:hypothetical protein
MRYLLTGAVVGVLGLFALLAVAGGEGTAEMPGGARFDAGAEVSESSCSAVPQKCSDAASLVSTPLAWESASLPGLDGAWLPVSAATFELVSAAPASRLKPPPRI